MSIDLVPPRAPVLLRILSTRSAHVGLIILSFVGVIALTAGIVYPGDPLDMATQPLIWPGQDISHPLGSDAMGRDLAAGLAHGARISLLVGGSAALVSLSLGTLVGAPSGYFGGRIDDVLMRITEIVQSIPAFLLVVVFIAIFDPKIHVVILSIGFTSWPTIARLVRAEFRSLKEADFVTVARSEGYGHGHLIFRQILPNALSAVVATASVLVANAILIESALSFLGMSDPNVVSWGAMIGTGRELLRTAWYLTALPGAAIILTILALNLIGEAVNDALNPRINGRHR